MSIAFEVPGKCLLKQGSTTIGMSDADDFITVNEKIFKYEAHSNESGPNIPALIIEHGRYCEIRAPLTQFDRTALAALAKAEGATLWGQLGTLGASITAASWSIVPAISGQFAYTFPTTYFIDAIPVEGFGIKEHKIIIVLKAIASVSALSTATTAYFSTAQV